MRFLNTVTLAMISTATLTIAAPTGFSLDILLERPRSSGSLEKPKTPPNEIPTAGSSRGFPSNGGSKSGRTDPSAILGHSFGNPAAGSSADLPTAGGSRSGQAGPYFGEPAAGSSYGMPSAGSGS